jgi:hypothetical protein
MVWDNRLKTPKTSLSSTHPIFLKELMMMYCLCQIVMYFSIIPMYVGIWDTCATCLAPPHLRNFSLSDTSFSLSDQSPALRALKKSCNTSVFGDCFALHGIEDFKRFIWKLNLTRLRIQHNLIRRFTHRCYIKYSRCKISSGWTFCLCNELHS